MNNTAIKSMGFTLIELMIVMTIVALLGGIVGPLAINSLDKARAKEEKLSIKNWLRKVSAIAFATGKEYKVELEGKNIALYSNSSNKLVILEKSFDYLSFQPQILTYNSKGFVSPAKLTVSYKGNLWSINLAEWVNNEIHFE